MRLDFNVLWVEDNQANVLSQKNGIDRRLRAVGFRLNPIFAKSVEEATDFLDQDIYKDNVDLVLMDYHLGTGMDGDEGLIAVRERIRYRDIIFYSATSTAQLGKLVAEKQVQGVFLSSRDFLPEIVYEVFENLINKVLDIDHARGVALGALSEIEYAINKAMVKVFNECNEPQKLSVLSSLRKTIGKKKNKMIEEFEKIAQYENIQDLQEHHAIFTAYDRAIFLRNMMKLQGIHQEYKANFVEYESNLIPRRNEYAHIRVVQEGFSRKFYNSHKAEISSDHMREIRIKLLEFEELIKTLFPDDETEAAAE